MMRRDAQSMSAQGEKERKINELTKVLQELNAKDYKRSDVGSAQLFSDVFKDRHRYNVSARDWFVYNAGVWELDSEGMAARTDLKMLGEALLRYVSSLDLQQEDKQAYITYAAKWLKAGYRLSVLNDSKDQYFFNRDQMDGDVFALNCQNGVLFLKDGKVKFLQHKPEYLFSKMAGTTYDPAAKCPRWIQFLDEVTEGDREKQRYIQKIAGLALVGDVPEHKFFIIYGSSTRNGKSTLTETLLSVMGTYGATINPETLAIQKTDSRRASGDVARLAGVRLAICSEAPRRMPLDSALLKKLTGGERILARHLQEREFEFQPQFTMIMNTNYLPATTDSTVFSSGRINVCEFNRHFTEAEQDKHLKEKLLTESAGILNWMIAGYQAYMEEGLAIPDTVVAETRQFEQESDRLSVFLSECLEQSEDPEAYISVKDAYPLYSAWCEDSGYQPLGKQGFTAELKTKRLYREHFYLKSLKCNVYRVIVGYRKPLKDENIPFPD